MIKLSDYVMEFVSKLGVKHVFLLPGGGCMHLVDSLGKNKKLKYTCNLHEQASAVAADAYAQYTGNIGVALVTTGPGSTNAITGVAASWIDSTPVLILAGQAKRADLIGKTGVRQMGIQEVDIVPLVQPVTKYAVTVMDPYSIRYHLEKAVYLAKTGRPGPVWITIPLDVQGALIYEKKLKRFNPSEIKSGVDEEKVARQTKKVIELIKKSERPIILAGNGIRLSGAKQEFLRLIEELNIPILTTWRADDLLPEDHKLYFGRPGVVGQRGANFIQQNSDLIITIGARLDLGQIGFDHQNFAREAKKVIVDVDPAEIKKLKMRVDVPIVSDAGLFINSLLKAAKAVVKQKDSKEWMARCRDWKKRYPVVIPKYYKEGKHINTYVLIDVLSDLMKGTDVLVPGSSGSCAEITQQAIRIKEGLRILNTPGLGSMGFGLPASIGACIASGRRTITIIGDGGLQHNIQELETLARLKLPVKIFILNNRGYASIRNMQDRYFPGHLVCCDSTSGLTLPDTCKVAKAYGIKAVRIAGQKGLKAKINKALDFNGPVICDVMIDPAQETAPRIASYVKPDGSMVSKPLEDLWPFLDREEFQANMIIKTIKE